MAHQPKSTPLTLGATAPDFSLSATNGKEYSLSRGKGSKGTVVAFTCNHCPYVKAYDQRLNDLAQKFQSQGIAFFAINANDATQYPDDSFDKMRAKAERLALCHPYLRDETQQVALDYGAGCTPEFYLFDAQLQLVYTGRLDDNMDEPARVSKRYLHDACVAVLAGETPNPQQTHPIGCSIKWS